MWLKKVGFKNILIYITWTWKHACECAFSHSCKWVGEINEVGTKKKCEVVKLGKNG
jgi:hypothetical protein